MLSGMKAALDRQGAETQQKIIYLTIGIFVLLLVGLIVPARDFYHASTDHYAARYEVLQWMKAQQGRLEAHRALAAEVPSDSDDSLIAMVTQSAEKYGITVSQYRPEGNAVVQLSTQNMRVSDTLEWIDDLQSTHGLRVNSMSLTKAEHEGFCNLQIEFRAASQGSEVSG